MKKILMLIAVLTVTVLLMAGCTINKEPPLIPEQTVPGPVTSPEQTAPSPVSSPETIPESPDVTPAPTTQEPATGPSTGTIKVLVTDAPKHDVSRVELTVSEVEVHKAGSDEESGNWTTLEIQEETFNLLDLQNGLTMLLADGEIEAGKYTQIRMTVFEVIVDYDDVVGVQAEVPSNQIKFVRPFTLEAGGTITLLVDIDAAKSVIVTGGVKQQKSKVLFKPVIKLQVTHEGGTGPQEPSEPEDQDTQSPSVEVYSPADNATGVAQNTDLVLTFDEDIMKGTGNITIKKYSDDSVFEVIDVNSSNVTISGAEVTINPTFDFTGGTGYYVLIDATALTDTVGNSYAGISDKDTWNFTTVEEPDIQEPTVLIYYPLDDATDVVKSDNLTLTFDEDMAKGTGNITIKKYSDDSIFEEIDITSSNITISGAEVTINPSVDFVGGTGYYIIIDATALTDTEGNNFAGISNKEIWNFTSQE